jgi:hypothetical protein
MLKAALSMYQSPATQTCGFRRCTVAGVLRGRAEIGSQMSGVEAPSWQGEKAQEYLVYSEVSQRSSEPSSVVSQEVSGEMADGLGLDTRPSLPDERSADNRAL